MSPYYITTPTPQRSTKIRIMIIIYILIEVGTFYTRSLNKLSRYTSHNDSSYPHPLQYCIKFYLFYRPLLITFRPSSLITWCLLSLKPSTYPYNNNSITRFKLARSYQRVIRKAIKLYFQAACTSPQAPGLFSLHHLQAGTTFFHAQVSREHVLQNRSPSMIRTTYSTSTS